MSSGCFVKNFFCVYTLNIHTKIAKETVSVLLASEIYLRPKVTSHCYYIYLFWVFVSGILNVLNSY